MTKTNKKTLEEIIRVDHAGERGAIKIYEGQLLALNTFKQNEYLKKKIEEMKEHENEHYDFFDNEIGKRIPNSNYYFIGKEDEINALNQKKKIKSFSQISLEKDNNFGIWKIILND